MSVDLESRFLREPDHLPGQMALGRIDHLFVPHDEAPMGYWRKPDGYITLNQYGDNGTEKKLDRGFERLGKYGSFSSSAMANVKDPLLPLVLNGGLIELPPQQIKELGWHRSPDRSAKRSHREVDQRVQAVMQQRGISRDEALLAVMPQLAGYDLTDWTCPLHAGRFFPTLASKMAHDEVMHKDALQAEATGRAVAAAQGALGAPAAAAAGAVDTNTLVSLIAQQGDLIAEMKAKIDALEGAKAPAKGSKPKADTAAE